MMPEKYFLFCRDEVDVIPQLSRRALGNRTKFKYLLREVFSIGVIGNKIGQKAYDSQ
jgi:hypothetical protein